MYCIVYIFLICDVYLKNKITKKNADVKAQIMFLP